MAVRRGTAVVTQLLQKHGPLQNAFAMVKGDGEESYSKNSGVQAVANKTLDLVLREALETVTLPSKGSPVVVADLGSASGPNSIANIALIVDRLRLRLPKDAEMQAYFNDLPSNDFNNLFQLLSSDKRAKDLFIAGVPGSFYDRRFAQSSVHVFHSSLSLHFLSKIPDVVLQKDSPAYNKGNLWIMHSRSAVATAYQQQASLDLKNFLQARAAELVSGGLLFFQCAGRTTTEPNELVDETVPECFSMDLNEVWSDLVEEGLVTEEQRDTFNIPMYFRSIEELRTAIESCSSLFHVRTTQVQKTVVSAFEAFQASDINVLPRKMTGMFKAALDNLIEMHVGKEVSEVIWQRYEKLLEKKKALSELKGSMCIITLIRK